MTTWPGARTTLPDGRDLVVLEARPEQAGGAEAPGTLLDDATLLVRTGDGGAVRLARVKPAGKAAMADDAFQRGARVERVETMRRSFILLFIVTTTPSSPSRPSRRVSASPRVERASIP